MVNVFYADTNEEEMLYSLFFSFRKPTRNSQGILPRLCVCIWTGIQRDTTKKVWKQGVFAFIYFHKHERALLCEVSAAFIH